MKAVLLTLILLTPAAALAQVRIELPRAAFDTQGTPRAGQRPPQPREPFLRAYFMTDLVSLAAADTFDAVVGTSRLTLRGGGGEVLGLWRGLFARVTYAAGEQAGERVVVFGDEVIPLGIPLTVQVRPLEIGGGWRFAPVAGGRLVPYAGAGLLRVGYRERSEFARPEENIDTTDTGRVFFGGIEASLVSWVIAGLEVQHRSVPGALGGGGLSEAFNESDLGGTTVRLLIGIRR